MKNAILVLFSAIALILLAGCASSAPVAITELSGIVGTWKSDPPALAIKILPDGTVLADITSTKIDEGAQWELMFSFEGDHLIIGGWLGCAETSVGSYEVQKLPNGNLDFSAVEDDCVSRVSGFMGQRAEPVIDVEWVRVE